MSDTTKLFASDITKLMFETRRFLNDRRIIPRSDSATDSVLLGLLSKSIVLAEAIVSLVDSGFEDEAYGLCRSSVEIQLTVRYLTNASTISRCRRYFLYFTKDKSEWFKLIRKYYPNLSMNKHSDAKEIEKLALAYKNPNKWSEAPGGLRDFAAEKDNFVLRDDGRPADELFYYEVLYKWMSHYVHVTEPAIEPEHMPLPGDEFTVHYGKNQSKRGRPALRTSLLSVLLNLLRIFRFFNMDVPESLKEQFQGAVKADDERVSETVE